MIRAIAHAETTRHRHYDTTMNVAPDIEVTQIDSQGIWLAAVGPLLAAALVVLMPAVAPGQARPVRTKPAETRPAPACGSPPRARPGKGLLEKPPYGRDQRTPLPPLNGFHHKSKFLAVALHLMKMKVKKGSRS